MNDNIQSTINKNEETIKLGEIAEVKKIFLHEVQAEDLILSCTLEYMGKENDKLRPVMTIFDDLEFVKKDLDYKSIYDDELGNAEYGFVEELNKKKEINEKRGNPYRQYLEFDFKGKKLTTKEFPVSDFRLRRTETVFDVCVHVLRLKEKQLDFFLPEYIQMELIKKIPKDLWENLYKDLNTNLLSVEICTTDIKEQEKIIKNLIIKKHKMIWKKLSKLKPHNIFIISKNNIQAINSALNILKAESIKMKGFVCYIESLKNTPYNSYLSNLQYFAKQYFERFPYLLISNTDLDEYFKKAVDKQRKEDNLFKIKFHGKSSDEIEKMCLEEVSINKNGVIEKAVKEAELFDKFLSDNQEDILPNESEKIEFYKLRHPKSIFNIVVNTRLRIVALKIPQCLIHIKQLTDKANNMANVEKRIRRSFSHHIKNMISAALISPLNLIRNKGLDDEGLIDEALRGANLLREIINAMNLSYSGAKKDLIYDVINPDPKARTISQILYIALQGAFANMLDGKYFNQYYSEYFPEPEKLFAAKEDFISLPNGNMDALLGYGQKYLIEKIEFYCPEKILNLKIGTKRNSALKMIILFQEICMNAVKNSAFLKRHDRTLKIDIRESDMNIAITIMNSYDLDPEKQSGDTLVGEKIIKDFTCHMGLIDKSEKSNAGQFIRCIEMPTHFELE